MPNLKLAFRTLANTPFVTAVAVLSLALGIGANAAIFSAFDQILLRPLPVSEPGRLVNLGNPGPKPGSQSCGQAGDCDVVFSYPMFRDLEKAQVSFTGIAAHHLFGTNLSYETQTESGEALEVSGSYFNVLGLTPALGRLFGPPDDQVLGGNPVAVLSYSYWRDRLGADSGVLNRNILIGGHPMTIVGVAPRDFEGTTVGARPKVYVPISMHQVFMSFGGFERRRDYWIYLFARLKPGVSIEQAKVAMDRIYRPIITDVEAPLQQGMSDQTMARFRAKELRLEPGSRGQSNIRRNAETPLALLFATTAIVLLIACANIANLLLARAANRGTEMAVRLSLGATRAQLMRQLLTESFVLAALGGAASLIIAFWTIDAMMGLLPGEIAITMQLRLQPAALWYAAALAVGTGLLFGIFPALHSTRPDLDAVLRAGSGKISGARAAARFRATLATAQIALSMALLMSAGLFLRSLHNISRVNLGLEVDNVTTFAVAPQLNGYESARSAALFARIEEGLVAVPGVTSVAAARVPLLANNNWGNSVSVQGFKHGPDVDNSSMFNEVGPGYFRTVGIHVLAGREFTATDVAGAARVAVVNEAFAKKFGLGKDAVGKFMSIGDNDSLNIQIVGLAQDAKYSDVKRDIPPVYFLPYKQNTKIGLLHFYARSAGDPRALIRAIPPLVNRLDPTLPVEDLKTMPQQIRENVFLDRMIGILSSSFALLATLLAAVGLYGVLAYSVAQRTREIGVRMALGADRARVLAMVLRQVGVMTAIGAPIGIAGALALSRGSRSMLFELQAADPWVMAASVAILSLVALGAGWLPARKASHVDPMQALRYE